MKRHLAIRSRHIRYLTGCLIAGPLLPITYYQASRVYHSVPKLPEASDPQGFFTRESKQTLKVLAIGESTVAGVGVDRHDQGFAGTFARIISENLDTNVDWKVYAKSGYTAKKVRREIVPEIDESHADLILIGLGGNDTFMLNSPWGWRRDLRKLIEDLRLKFGATPLLFSNMPPVKLFPAFTPLMRFTLGNLIEILGEETEDVCQDLEEVYYYPRKITFEDWHERLGINAQPDDYFSDGVHPSKLTYQILAKDLAQFLLENDNLRNRLANGKLTR